MCLWVSDGGDCKHIYKGYHKLDAATVKAWVKALTKDGVPGNGGVCPYDEENLKDAGARIMDLIGHKLQQKVTKGGTTRLDSITVLYCLLSTLQ